MEMSNSIINIAPALLRAQRNMGAAVKDSKNPFFKSMFATLNSVREASHPSLNAEGIIVLQPTITKDGKAFVRTLLMHESGEYIAGDTEIISGKPLDPQAAGSAISYARRYGLQSFLSLGTADDDGNSAMPTTSFSKQENKVADSPLVETKKADVVAAAVKANGSFKKAQAPKEAPVNDDSGWD